MARRRRLAITAVAVVVVAAMAIYVGWRWWQGRPPFGPDELAATASLELTTNDAAQHAVGEAVVVPYADLGDQLLLGRVSWHAPPKGLAGGHFTIILIDKRTHLNGSYVIFPMPCRGLEAC